MDATELFLKQCKEAGADPNALLTFGLRKLKKVGPPKVSEYSSQFKVETGKVVGEQPAESDVDGVEGGGADIPVATAHNVVLKKPLSFLDDDDGKRPVTVERAVFATGCFAYGARVAVIQSEESVWCGSQSAAIQWRTRSELLLSDFVIAASGERAIHPTLQDASSDAVSSPAHQYSLPYLPCHVHTLTNTIVLFRLPTTGLTPSNLAAQSRRR